MISLSRAGLDDTTLQELISELPDKCIALMEDIDAAFSHGIKRPTTENTGSPTADNEILSQGGVTLSGLLNSIDGVAAREGRLLFATTNHVESLDPALRRPGRMDRHIEFKLASRYQVAQMFRRFYDPSIYASPPPEKPIPLHTDEKDDGSPGSIPVSLIDFDTDVGTFSSESSNDEHQQWQTATRDDQARTFASFVPDRSISMAQLQGYLLLHRSDPVSALAGIREFVREKVDREEGIESRKLTLDVE